MQSIYAFIPVAGAAPLGYPSDQRPALSTRLPHPVCDFDGNADFYGLGIRVGIYLQWISSLLANRYVPEAIRNLLITNTIFLLAVAIAAAQSTAAGTLRKAESLAVQHLCFGFLFTILSIWGFRIRTKVKVSGAVFSLAEKSFRLGLSAAICGYGVWYWFVGNYKLSRESCSTATFVFGKVDSLGAIRYFYQIQSVILLLVYGILFTRLCLSWAWIATKSLMKSVMLAAALATVDRIWGRSGHLIVNFVRRWIQTFSLRFWLAINGRMVSPEFSVPTAMHEFPLLNGMIVICWMIFQYCSLLILGKIMWPKEPPLLRLNSQTFNKIPSPFKKFPTHLVWANFFASLNSICLLWGIAATECTIYWNHIYNVYSVSSTGQLIPLIIGIANFIQIVYTIILQKSQPITSDIVLKAIVGTGKDTSSIDKPDQKSKANSRMPDRYRLNKWYEAIFWRNSPTRRRSIDVLMPTRYLPEMTLGVATPDMGPMELMSAKEPTASRRHSCCGSQLEKFRLYDTKPIEAEPPRHDIAESTQDGGRKKRPKHSEKAAFARREVEGILVSYLLKNSETLRNWRKAVEGIRETADNIGLVDNSPELPIQRAFGTGPESRYGSNCSSPSPAHCLAGSRTTDGYQNRPPPQRRPQSRTAFPNRIQYKSKGPPAATMEQTQPPRLPPPPPSPPPSPLVPLRNMGPHLVYTPAHLPEPSAYPEGLLRTALRSLTTAASLSMPDSPEISATAAKFADMLSELGDIRKERREGRISREEQDELLNDWAREFENVYLMSFWNNISGDPRRDFVTIERVVTAVLEREVDYAELKERLGKNKGK